MRLTTSLLAGLAAGMIAMPVAAQQDSVSLGIFVTVRAADVPDFEEATREHNQWHASQNDPQGWATFQALTGHGEYAVIANMTWGSLDAPVVDMGTDVAHWAETGAEFAASEDIRMWTTIPGGSPPTDPRAYPVAQVYELFIRPGAQPALMNAIETSSPAMALGDVPFQWSAVVSADGPPSVFLVLWFEDFASLGTPGPGPEAVMANAFGAAESARLVAQFTESTTPGASQIWIHRPDLSYVPGT